MPRPTRLTAAVGTLAAAGLTFALGVPAAHASGTGTLRIDKRISSAFVGPLQFDVSRHGIHVADGFTSTLNKVGVKAPLATGGDPSTGGDVGGVATNRRGDIAYTTSNGDHTQTFLIVLRNGRELMRADLAAYEKDANPDGGVTYGAPHPSACAKKALEDAGVPVLYKGGVDSHPYAVASLKDGSWAVADAGGNDILHVSKKGAIRTLAVLPRRAWTVPADFVEEQHLPSCVTGTKYWVEGVPTDVEAGPHGTLYMSSLPGAEAANLGAIYRWKRGHVTRIGDHFNLPTNIALSRYGHIYVAELGSGRISVLSHGGPRPVIDLPGAVGVEVYGTHLYASVAPALIGSQDPGSIVRLGKVRSGS